MQICGTMKSIYLSLGSNLGEREQNLAQAIHLLENEAGIILRCSPLFETEPWGFETEQQFLNLALELDTLLSPHELLQKCLEIESRLGRIRTHTQKGYQSRTIDIDLLFFGNELVSDERLTLPHPHLQKRRFILEPLAAIAPDFVHPVLGQSIQQLLNHCTDQCHVSQRGNINL